jgi:hypothetical protein
VVTVEINVTKKDIAQGVCSDGTNCPIARAAIRAGFDEVGVDSLGLVFGYGNLVRTTFGSYFEDGGWANLPKVAKTFVETFDGQGEVKPFKFRVKLKNSVAKQLKLRKSAIVSA